MSCLKCDRVAHVDRHECDPSGATRLVYHVCSEPVPFHYEDDSGQQIGPVFNSLEQAEKASLN